MEFWNRASPDTPIILVTLCRRAFALNARGLTRDLWPAHLLARRVLADSAGARGSGVAAVFPHTPPGTSRREPAALAAAGGAAAQIRAETISNRPLARASNARAAGVDRGARRAAVVAQSKPRQGDPSYAGQRAAVARTFGRFKNAMGRCG